MKGRPDGTKPSRRPGRLPRWERSIARILPGPARPVRGTDQGQPWRIAYALDIGRAHRRLLPLRIRVRRDGTDGQVAVLKRFAPADAEHIGHSDRLIMTWISSGLGRARDRKDPEGTELLSWRWHDILLLLRDKELYATEGGILNARRITVQEEPARLLLTLSESGRDLALFPEIEWKGVRIPVSSDMARLSADPLWIFTEDRIVRVAGLLGSEFDAFQRMAAPLTIPFRDRALFLEEVLPQLLSRHEIRSEVTGFRTVAGEPAPRLLLRETESRLTVELRFGYGDVEVPGRPTHEGRPEIIARDGMITAVRRNAEQENRVRTDLLAYHLVPRHGEIAAVYEPTLHPLEWLGSILPGLGGSYAVFGREQLRHHHLHPASPQLSMRLSSGIDWFDLSLDVRFEGTTASLDTVAAAIARNERFVRLDDGSYGVLPEEWLQRFRRTFALAARRGNALRFSRRHIGLLDDLASSSVALTADEGFDELRRRVGSFAGIEQHALPVHFQGTLRPYQETGFNWLLFLHAFSFGGILADDMGLGKTVQTLALLQKRIEEGDTGPSLVVVPTSLVSNWVNEAARFTPRLRVLVYRGLDRKRYHAGLESYDLVVTSYGILRRDIELLKEVDFLYVVLDESQNIKNYVSVNARAARRLKARHRLALSGTPLENNLFELWSQFEFLNPGMLGPARTFTEDFVRPVERASDASALASLRKLTGPFILRRTKELVAADLPAKFESTVLCDMEETQRSAYHHWREYYRRAIIDSIESVGIQRSRIKVLEGLTRLRQVCCHPCLVDPEFRGSSGKFDAFTEMLDDILAEGHKVLVFSQFVRMLAILRRHCDRRGIIYEYLDGRTVHRGERVERFQTDDAVRLFLISLKAGGTGLNLTAADYVVHYDPWWNPAVETQATDRTHRIGQTKQVFSYKLITRESVEEKIVELQERKRALVREVGAADDGLLRTLTLQDIQQLFG